MLHKLSDAKIRKLTKPGRYGDGGGLWLKVSVSVSPRRHKAKQRKPKSWVFQYTSPLGENPKVHQMGLGPYPDISLAKARGKSAQLRAMLLDKKDPLVERQSDKRRSIPFREAAAKYIAEHSAGWRNKKHAAQWPSTLETYVYPVIGDMPVSEIHLDEVKAVLTPIWKTKTETTTRVRSRIESILDWAKAMRLREGDNPAKWTGPLKTQFTKPSKLRMKQHHKAVPYDDMPAFMAALRANDSVSARALEFTILTAARTSAVTGAVIGEIDLGARTWTVPPERPGVKANEGRC